MRCKLGRQGFTLVELLIVIIIIAVLAAIAIPRIVNSSLRSKESSLKSQLNMVRGAVERFKQDTGLLPIAIADMASDKPPNDGMSGGNQVVLDATTYHGPYLDQEPKDPLTDKPFGYSVDKFDMYQVHASASGKASDGTDYQDW